MFHTVYIQEHTATYYTHRNILIHLVHRNKYRAYNTYNYMVYIIHINRPKDNVKQLMLLQRGVGLRLARHAWHGEWECGGVGWGWVQRSFLAQYISYIQYLIYININTYHIQHSLHIHNIQLVFITSKTYICRFLDKCRIVFCTYDIYITYTIFDQNGIFKYPTQHMDSLEGTSIYYA